MIVALAVIFPLLYVSTLEGIKSCDDKLKEMSALYKVPKSQQIFKFYLPCVARRVYSDAVSILALNVKLIIAAEALAQTNLSIGGEMKVAKEALETAELFAWTVCAVVLSYLMELVLKLIKKVLKGVVKNVRN